MDECVRVCVSVPQRERERERELRFEVAFNLISISELQTDLGLTPPGKPAHPGFLLI